MNLHRVRRRSGAGKDEMGLVGDDPLDGLGLGELHGLGDGGGEVDGPLLAGGAFDELNFGWKSHAGTLVI